MDSPEVMEVGSICGNHAVEFVDLSGLDKESAGWMAAYLVHDSNGWVGLIEVEQATAYFRFTPAKPKPGMQPLGDFSADMLKRRVTAWLADQSAVCAV